MEYISELHDIKEQQKVGSFTENILNEVVIKGPNTKRIYSLIMSKFKLNQVQTLSSEWVGIFLAKFIVSDPLNQPVTLKSH